MAVIEQYNKIAFRNVLEFTWDLGIPVLPIRDRREFHGAFWRIDGRNVIVLKQNSNSESRWMFDLLRGLYHAARQPHESSLGTISAPEDSAERRNSEEEILASRFAADVILNESAEEVAQQSLNEPRTNPWETARDVFLERFPFVLDNEIDRGLLGQALKAREDDQLGLDNMISAS